MAMLTKDVSRVFSDETAAANYHDFHAFFPNLKVTHYALVMTALRRGDCGVSEAVDVCVLIVLLVPSGKNHERTECGSVSKIARRQRVECHAVGVALNNGSGTASQPQ